MYISPNKQFYSDM